MMDDTHIPLLTFRLGRQEYALTIGNVVEVSAMVAYLPMQSSGSPVIGLANRRGQALPLVDMRRVFGHPSPLPDAQSLFIVVTRADDGICAGFIVDVVQQVEYLPWDGMSSVNSQPMIRTVLMDGTRMVQLVAVESVFAQYVDTVASFDEFDETEV